MAREAERQQGQQESKERLRGGRKGETELGGDQETSGEGGWS